MALNWHVYDGMLPNPEISGKRGYYPVSNKEEWEQLPDLYKVMDWDPVKDPFNKGTTSAVKSVIFDVTHMEPFGINAKVSVHPSDVHKILFCLYDKPDCHLYTISGIELENGTRLGAKWMQDTMTGSFAIYCGGTPVAKQGGFMAHIPERVKRLEDGSFKYDFSAPSSKTTYYTLLNPFRNFVEREDRSEMEISKEAEKPSGLDSMINRAESRSGSKEITSGRKNPNCEHEL